MAELIAQQNAGRSFKSCFAEPVNATLAREKHSYQSLLRRNSSAISQSGRPSVKKDPKNSSMERFFKLYVKKSIQVKGSDYQETQEIHLSLERQ